MESECTLQENDQTFVEEEKIDSHCCLSLFIAEEWKIIQQNRDTLDAPFFS